MLVYPFTFYAANGLEKALRWRDKCDDLDVKRFSWKRSKKTTLGIVLSVVLIGTFYASTPVWSNYIRISVPALRYFSWTPTVPLQDVDDTVEVIEWLNGRMNDDSCVLVQHVFLGWAKLYLDNEHTIVYFTADVEAALDTALEHGFDSVYSLWWNENVGLYGLTVPSYFSPVFESGRIAAFQYLG
jgi:hypothetical protein